MGFQTIALGRGKDKEPLAKKLGAHHYIDSDVVDPVKELQKLGGARVILATAPSAKAISSVVDGLGVNGNLLVPAAPNDPLTESRENGDFPLPGSSRSVSKSKVLNCRGSLVWTRAGAGQTLYFPDETILPKAIFLTWRHA
jgi:D-arabinose 1-dehydrogenase-like Zn-dependent alcohol dehydrogenase